MSTPYSRIGTLCTATALCLWTTLAWAQASGSFPPEPFNGLQAHYRISGATVTKFADVPGFTWTRTLTISGLDGSGRLAVSGTLTAGGYGADVQVGVSAGDKSYSASYKVDPERPTPFDVGGPVPKNARSGSVTIFMTGHYNAGTRGVVVKSSWDSYGQTTTPADPTATLGTASPAARFQELLRRYPKVVPEGRAADGPDNNKLSNFKDGYDRTKCGGYQGTTLSWLDGLRQSSNPAERALVENVSYGPIQSGSRQHYAVVVYPKNTDWRQTGVVFDPWPTQNHAGQPITYPIKDWSRRFWLPKESDFDHYKGRYFNGPYPDERNATKLPREVTVWTQSQPESRRSAWQAITSEAERNAAVLEAYGRRHQDTSTTAHCPLNVYLVDGQGRISGFPGGQDRHEIPGVGINTLRLADGTYWTELNYRREPGLRLVFEGTGAGRATVTTAYNVQADPAERRIYEYELQVEPRRVYTLEQRIENAPIHSTVAVAPTSPPVPPPPPPAAPAQPRTVFNNWNIGGVGSGPVAPTVFELATPLRLTYLNTYHYHFGRGAPAGTIALRHADGTVLGPWQTRGVLSSGAPDGTWEVTLDVVLKPGRYTVLDSSPSTWSQNAESGGRGFADVRGQPLP